MKSKNQGVVGAKKPSFWGGGKKSNCKGKKRLVKNKKPEP